MRYNTNMTQTYYKVALIVFVLAGAVYMGAAWYMGAWGQTRTVVR